GVQARGATGGHGLDRTLGAETFRHRGGQGARGERPVQLGLRLPVVHVPALTRAADQDVVVLKAGGAAHGRTQGDPDPPGGLPAQVETGVPDRLVAGDQGELYVPVRPLDLLGVQAVCRRVEVALGGDPRPEARGVEEGDAARRGPARGEQIPERRYAHTPRSDDAYARNRHAPGHDRTCPTVTASVSSVSTCPRAGRGASGPRWKTIRASTLPTLRKRCFMLMGIISPCS